MGVRGLTSYIARNAERYLEPYELHDCDLVIDGDNLSCNLFKDVSGCNAAFGGDYDAFYRSVVNFFHLLSECNIRAFVLLDGGYEAKKLKSVEQRLRSKIGLVKHLNPTQSKPLFPLMMREVFVDALRDCGVSVMRCIFEADDELAVLARKLNCPVLSYDSDFYIHNVKYIPLVTLTLKVHTKNTMDQQNARKLRQCEAKNIAKRTQLKPEESETKPLKKGKHKTVKYLDCCIYTIKNLAGQYLKMEMLPLFAALLGNDYIERRAFKKFYTQLGFRGRNNTVAKQQKRIKAILKWLRHETKESAIEKILTRVPKEQRPKLQQRLESATSGYSCETSEAFDFFELNEEEFGGEGEEGSDEDFEEVCSSTDEEGDAEEIDENEDAEEVSGEETEEEEISEGEEEEANNDNQEDDNEGSDSNGENDDATSIEEHLGEVDPSSLPTVIPEWLKQRIFNAELPRYFSDLIHLRIYINNPQVENFLFEDCNEIALKILQYIFTIVNQPATPELRYLTRVVRLTKVHYRILQPLEMQFTYDPDVVDIDNFKAIFLDFGDHEEIFEHIKKLPNHLQLYFLTISYWARNTKRSTHIHLHSLIISLLVLGIIDSKVEPIRDLKRFQKRFGKIATKARKAKAGGNEASAEAGKKESDQTEINGPKQTESSEKKIRPIPDRIKFIPKSDCILVMESLLKYFHLNECFQRRHNDFSSTILHGFSEFQSVFYHLSALNAVFNYPFEPVRISQCFNGIFLYNIYANLKNRPDIQYYVLHFILNESETMAEFYTYLVEWCSDIIPLLEKNDTNKSSINKKLAKQKKKIPLTDIVQNVNLMRDGDDMIAPESNSDESEYNDLNNKFCMLLKVR